MSDAAHATAALLQLMARLRDPVKGCPWDREQTFASIAPYTVEEAYEVADAIDRNDPAQLRDELGDLLFQIVFHARLAEERGWFGFAQVAESIHAKLVRRHPHVFAGASVEDSQQQSARWEELKAQERAERASGQEVPDTSALAAIPKALPALARSAKLGKRAARVGFDWQESGQVREKVLEELREVDEALVSPAYADPGTRAHHVAEELGDLLFAIANWAVHLKFDPEEALRAANAKFERRFRLMESLIRDQGLQPESLSAAEWDELWRRAKKC
ncbi:MAG TPA: nucleoside triphosphate pyrophosphohydrolase [Steroidobacteraceae bacterium]|jgi:MazG family protein